MRSVVGFLLGTVWFAALWQMSAPLAAIGLAIALGFAFGHSLRNWKPAPRRIMGLPRLRELHPNSWRGPLPRRCGRTGACLGPRGAFPGAEFSVRPPRRRRLP
jgi:hypothetical protein